MDTCLKREGARKMEDRESRTLRAAAVCSAVACLLQIVGLVRYVARLPDDWVGIGLYATTIIALAIGAAGFYIRARQ
jgi:hypothetical protein